MISVIVPVLNEETSIENTLKHLEDINWDFETLIVDGGSVDRTVDIAKKYGQVVMSKKGRAIQMNTGAAWAKGDILFFLHGDCLPEKNAFLEVERIMSNSDVVGGALRYAVEDQSFLYRNHVFWSNLRARLTGIYLGDHGIFVKRNIFDKIGGFPIIPIMEDVSLCKKLKGEGKLVQANARMISSSRRFKQKGYLKTVLKMWANRFLFFFGVSPKFISRIYGDVR